MLRRYRPVIQIPRTLLEHVLEILAILCVVGLIAITLWGWLTLPAIIPTHFGISGQPDAYGDKGGLLILPVTFLLVYVFFTFLERFPHIYNYPLTITEENASWQYKLARMLLEWIKLEILAMGIILQWNIIQSTINHNGSRLLLVVFFLPVCFFATIIIYLNKARRAR